MLFSKDQNERTPEHFYNQIPPAIENTFSKEQSDAVKDILNRIIRKPKQKIIDLRFSLWLFKPLYLVLLVSKNKEQGQNKYSPYPFSNTINKITSMLPRIRLKSFFMSIAAILLVWLILLILYKVKTAMNINIFPDKHLIDFFKR
jgi:hypothetical protein